MQSTHEFTLHKIKGIGNIKKLQYHPNYQYIEITIKWKKIKHILHSYTNIIYF